MQTIAPEPAPLPDYLARLNPAQREAVLHGDGPGAAAPLLVIAGAGSGKTNTLAHRVAHLMLKGADPRRMLIMTFSRRAAQEMTARVERIAREVLGAEGAALAGGLDWAGTFHGMGARLLREYAPLVGLDEAFTIHDREDSADLMNLLRHELGFGLAEARFPSKSACLAIYSRSVNAQAPLDGVLAEGFPKFRNREAELRRLFAAYVEAKQDQGVLDYDDLLLYWRAMVGEAGLGAEIGARFDHVLVDEYQDTNRLQAAILLGLSPQGRGLTVVGDDAQAIYAFRAAEVRNILDFPGLFTPRARVVTLEQNYRSTAPVLAAANAVIGEARERFSKTLWTARGEGARPGLVTVHDEAAQAGYICRAVLEAREEGTALKDQAVLFRTSSHSGPLEVELTRRNIPFVKFGGLKFLDSAHVKDLLAVLRLRENPRDRVAGFRVLRLIPGIGTATARAVLDALAAPGAGVAEALGALRVPARAAPFWPAFRDMMLNPAEAPWPAELEAVRLWYEPHLERLHEDAETRRSDLLQLGQIAAGHGSRSAFLTDLTLDPPDATSDESGVPLLDDDYLVLSTIHSAKGREWRNVFVLNVVDGCMPSDLGTGTTAGIEEERRLLYVAMTRARDALHLVTPLRFYTHGQRARGDRHVYAARSRFLTEAMLPLFERFAWTPQGTAGAAARPAVQPVDLRARMKDMWR
ncbi:ATP-dependent helicase (plasmid) [Paroceanicella profunda]|uniref:DNA 3'-5' helicase n=1 Tax=Paroceanicella profunda TaxID=2579971 RepID=A0A5B8G0P2_9RHOB|nr:ATP-dependent helicase [Paroceanicella profunda]QDL94285.1 ATP-dependent helicase [Paroceanicella profunda]